MNPPVIDWGLIGVLMTIIGTVWSLAWWLSNKFTELRGLFYTQVDKVSRSILDKLEYHEKHDDQRFSNVDQRFSSIKDDLWDIRIRNARVDNKVLEVQ